MEEKGKMILSLEEAKRFVANNTLPVNGTGNIARCVDGRYEKSEGLAGLPVPGADVGYVLAAFAALRKLGKEINDDIRSQVFDIVTEVAGGKFQFHTDDHCSEEVIAGGCGHFTQTKKNPDAYGLTSKDTSFVCSKLEELKQKGVPEDMLHGNHGERAVFVITSPEINLAPKYEEIQAFVYHKALDEKRRKALAEKIASIAGVGQEELFLVMTEVAEAHLRETLGRLANGLPVYTISGSVDNAVVQ